MASGKEAAAALRERHDGWTAARRARFLTVLAHTGCVRDACRVVGLASTNAYRTRARLPDFAKRWDDALARANKGLVATAYARAVEGVEEPIIRGDKVVATRRRYSDSLLALLIKRGDLSDARVEEEARRDVLSGDRLYQSEDEWQEALLIWLEASMKGLAMPELPPKPRGPDDAFVAPDNDESVTEELLERLARLRAHMERNPEKYGRAADTC